MRERMKKKETRRFLTRITGLVVALVMVATSFAALEGVVKVSAATATTITVSDGNIEGTTGTPIEDKTIEFSITNGEFDPACLWVGKDITDYFYNYKSMGTTYKSFNIIPWLDTNYGIYFTMPLGLKAVITEISATTMKCVISGTPLTPVVGNIKIYVHGSCIKDFQAATGSGTREYASCSANANAKWNVVTGVADNASKKSTIGKPNVTAEQLTGVAGETVFNVPFSIKLSNSIFIKDIPAGTDISSWFAGEMRAQATYSNKTYYNNQLPAGLSVVTVSDVKLGDKQLDVVLKGTPKYSNANFFAYTIPVGYVAATRANDQEKWTTISLSWPDDHNISTGSSKALSFNISGGPDEPYIMFNPTSVYAYAGESYTARSNEGITYNPQDGNRIKFFMALYNASQFTVDPHENAEAPWNDDESSYLYSNTKGNLDNEAEGFIYSPAKDGHLTVGYFGQFKDRLLFMAINGTPYYPGEYPVTYFVPTSYLTGYEGEQEYTTVVDSGAKLIIMKPFQLEVEDADIKLDAGAPVDEYITVKISEYSLKKFKNTLTTENLKFTPSPELKLHGITAEPVVVNTGRIVFHLTGNAKGNLELALEDCLTVDYSNFDPGTYADVERFGDIEINPNNKAKLTIGSGGYGIAGQEIDYTPREDVKVYAKIKGTGTVSGGAINLSGENPTLETDVAYKCYSTDGGEKWKEAKTKLSDKQIASLVNKGMTFCIADKYDKKEKGPGEGATIYEFAEIKKQEKAPKFKIDYTTWADATGNSTGQYILVGVGEDKSDIQLTATQLRETYEIGIVSGKTLNDNGYGVWPAKAGLTIGAVEVSGSKSKVVKTVYYVRTAPAVGTDGSYTPASKVAKVSVAGQQKAPNIKLDYKKEVIKAKENMSVVYGEDDTVLFTKITKEAAKTAVDISGCLQVGVRTDFKIWIAASAKKPASAIQEIKAAARAEAVTGGAITYNSSKHTIALDKKYEVYDETKQKWGGLPKINEARTYTLLVRKKADAKSGKENDTTYAAGETFKVIVKYGVYDAEKNKSGILEAPVYQLNQ